VSINFVDQANALTTTLHRHEPCMHNNAKNLLQTFPCIDGKVANLLLTDLLVIGLRQTILTYQDSSPVGKALSTLSQKSETVSQK